MRKLMDSGRKALTAAAFAGVGALGLAMLDGSLTGAEAIAAAGTGLVTGFGTYVTSPGPGYAAPRHRRDVA